ncbi:MAG: acyltransferase [Flavobacteriales bacterium]|nr:acyltransferase [Flavobacteriales bacterium]
MKAQSTGERIFGLDLMRATAGVMVVLSHTGHLVERHWPRFPNVPYVDWVGVFFVLSGFLIGAILLDSLAAKGSAMLRFADFMQRRWLRTLPNYYLFLVLNIWLVHIGSAPGMLSPATPAYAVFMQNFHQPLDLFFWESWSLAVEEWFYLLFPLLAFGAIALIGMHGERAFLMACVLFIVVPIGARALVAHHVTDDPSLLIWVKKLVITRLDAPGMGMLAALLAHQWPRAWRAVRWPTFIGGSWLLLAISHVDFLSAPVFSVYGLESMAALAVALLLPLLSTWRSAGPLDAPMRRLSLITYAMYLVHLPMLYRWGHLVPHPVAAFCALRYVLFLAVALALSALVFRCWERPFMRLREPAGRWLAAMAKRSA